ncbi:endonuclease domain-containing protein [Mycolicibacterium sp. Dal123E01]|uniref:endonuclease domain-containing protein n=1 Tax=Mycolicibacterium sp. Dal123E01 TaxID=3457578 RepID=UPI00403EF4A1
MTNLEDPFIGSEAITGGSLRSHQLRARYRAIFPNVYTLTDTELTLPLRARAGWLWSHRNGVLMGLTAAGLHGAKWLDDNLPVELVTSNARPPRGLRTQDICLHPEERMLLGDLPVTTPQRTAFDIGRRHPTRSTVARMDALLRASGLTVDDVAAIATQHPGARGLRQLETVLALVDAGAQSPRETWLRLTLIEAGLPRPQTQIPVRAVDGSATYYLDMGWEDMMVAVEYDGDHHRTDRWQYNKDNRRREELERLGWIVIRVLASDTSGDVVRRVRDARSRRAASLR